MTLFVSAFLNRWIRWRWGEDFSGEREEGKQREGEGNREREIGTTQRNGGEFSGKGIRQNSATFDKPWTPCSSCNSIVIVWVSVVRERKRGWLWWVPSRKHPLTGRYTNVIATTSRRKWWRGMGRGGSWPSHASLAKPTARKRDIGTVTAAGRSSERAGSDGDSERVRGGRGPIWSERLAVCARCEVKNEKRKKMWKWYIYI